MTFKLLILPSFLIIWVLSLPFLFPSPTSNNIYVCPSWLWQDSNRAIPPNGNKCTFSQSTLQKQWFSACWHSARTAMNSGTSSTLQFVGLLAALDLLAISKFFSVDKGGRLQVNLIIQVTLHCVRRFIQCSYHLCFLILVISQGHYDFLRQHMEGERQLIIVRIKDRARRESRCLFSWM